jgi:hypothetical protein
MTQRFPSSSEGLGDSPECCVEGQDPITIFLKLELNLLPRLCWRKASIEMENADPLTLAGLEN